MNLFNFADSLLTSDPEISPNASSSANAPVSRPLSQGLSFGGLPDDESNLTTSAMASPSKNPTLFLLDDILGTMNNTRTKVVERRNERKERQKTIMLERETARVMRENEGRTDDGYTGYNRTKEAALASIQNRKRQTPAGRAAAAAKALKKTKEIQDEEKAMERIAAERKASWVDHFERPIDNREVIKNHREDKKNILEAVNRRVARDKEAAENAQNQAPKEFVKRLAEKKEAIARNAALEKGKGKREAVAAGKAASQAVVEKYRKAQLTNQQMMEEEELEEEEYHRQKKVDDEINKVPVLSVDAASGARLGIKERQADFNATKQWKLFQSEVDKWEKTGGRNEPTQNREAFAEFLTDKYMCGEMDALPKTIIVTKVRKDMMRIIETFVAAPAKEEEENDDDDDSDESDIDTSFPLRRNSIGNVNNNFRGLSIEEQRKKLAAVTKNQLSSIEKRQDAEHAPHKDFDEFMQKQREKKKAAFAAKLMNAEKDKAGNIKTEQKLFQPWKCSICSKANGAEDKKCTVCGRAKNLDKKGKAPASGGEEDKHDMKSMKEENEKFAKINEDYMRFHKMKTKTDNDANQRSVMADDITSLLASLRGTLTSIETVDHGGQQLADIVKKPPVEHNEDWRVKNPKGRVDGRDTEEVVKDYMPPDVLRKQKREEFLERVGAGKEFAPHEGTNKDYGVDIKEVRYREAEKKKPFAAYT